MEAQKFEDSVYVNNVKAMCKIGMERTFSMLKSNDYIYYLHPDYYKERRTLQELHGVTNSIIESRMSKLESLKVENDKIHQKIKLTFLDILLQSNINGKSLTKEDIREEVDTFMFEVTITLMMFIAVLFLIS